MSRMFVEQMNDWINARMCRMQKIMALPVRQGFPGSASGNEPACQCRKHKRPGFDSWVGKIPLEKDMATHPSFLACGIAMDRGPWWATVHKESDPAEVTQQHTHTPYHTEHIYDLVCAEDCQSGICKCFRSQHNMLDSQSSMRMLESEKLKYLGVQMSTVWHGKARCRNSSGIMR